MGVSQRQRVFDFLSRGWRLLGLVLILLVPLLWLFSLPPIVQDPAYHQFIDVRPILGLPNSMDVLSNLAFLWVAVEGCRCCHANAQCPSQRAWMAFFVGLGLVSLGSAYYHWQPSDSTLVWDRLAMTVSFMAVSVALLGESLGQRLAAVALIPALLLGLFSVLYWHWSGDLRLYYWVQLVPILLVPSLMLLFVGRYSHRWLLVLGLGFYLLAKVAEFNDPLFFALTGELISGHSIKHLLAASGCYCLVLMLRKRKMRPL